MCRVWEPRVRVRARLCELGGVLAGADRARGSSPDTCNSTARERSPGLQHYSLLTPHSTLYVSTHLRVCTLYASLYYNAPVV